MFLTLSLWEKNQTYWLLAQQFNRMLCWNYFAQTFLFSSHDHNGSPSMLLVAGVSEDTIHPESRGVTHRRNAEDICGWYRLFCVGIRRWQFSQWCSGFALMFEAQTSFRAPVLLP